MNNLTKLKEDIKQAEYDIMGIIAKLQDKNQDIEFDVNITKDELKRINANSLFVYECDIKAML